MTSRPILSLEHEVVDDFNFDSFDNMQNLDRHDSSGSFNPVVPFQEAFNAPPSDIASTTPLVSSTVIPQLQVDEKTFPKICSGLANAVNAVMTVMFSKDSIKSIQEKYLRPDNCKFLKTPKMNIEISRELFKFSHAQNLALQDIQKSLISGLIPVIQFANECTSKLGKSKALFSDAITLLGHGIISLSLRRHANLRPFINDKFQPICNNDVEITDFLFGTDCMKKLKDLGDFSKMPIGNPKYKSGRRGLSSKGPARWQGNWQNNMLQGKWPGQNWQNQGYAQDLGQDNWPGWTRSKPVPPRGRGIR